MTGELLHITKQITFYYPNRHYALSRIFYIQKQRKGRKCYYGFRKKSSTECIAPPKERKVINWLFLKEAIFMEEFRQVSPKKTNKTQKTQTAR